MAMFRSFENVYSKSPNTWFSYIKHNYLDLVRNIPKLKMFNFTTEVIMGAESPPNN